MHWDFGLRPQHCVEDAVSLKHYIFILWKLCGLESLDCREALQERSHVDWEECDVIYF